MKFREYILSSGIKVIAGKSAENNEELIKQIENKNIILHTKEKGSPFCEIKSDGKSVSEKELYEASVFCAKYSQDWRNNKKDVIVHVFKGKDVFKEEDMKTGTFGVKGFKTINVKKIDIKIFEEKCQENQ